MERVSLITYMCLLMVSCLNGAPFKHNSHMGDAKTDSKIISTVDCSENCSFVITESSLSDAQKVLAKFLNLKKSMLIYVNIDSHNLTLCPDDDQQKQNQMREWQWIMSTNSWYINLPIDLDYASFHVTYSGESRIRLKIEAIESNCCSISDAGIEQVRNLLWSDLFTNISGSLLCNRYFDHQEWKSTFYAFTTVWIGYDLLCIAPTIDKSYQEKSHAAASVLTPLFCFFIALYHPLINKIIENRYIKRQLKKVNKSEGEMELYDYTKGDKPFGYERMVLKCFFSKNNKIENGNGEIVKETEKNRMIAGKNRMIAVKHRMIAAKHKIIAGKSRMIAAKNRMTPAIKLNFMYFIIYLIFNIVPLMLEHYHDKEELEDFDSIYKLGLPVFHFGKPKEFDYSFRIGMTIVLLLLVCIANSCFFYQFSKGTDFLIILKFPTVANKSKDENTVWYGSSRAFSEDVDRIIENLKTRRSKCKRVNMARKMTRKRQSDDRNIQTGSTSPVDNNKIIQEQPNTTDEFINSFYSKFIKRFTLLFSLVFWKYIFDLSTKISYDSQSKSNGDNENSCCSCCFNFLIFCFGLIIVLPINFVLVILTCAFPVLWFVMFPVLNQFREVFHKDKESTTETNDPTTVREEKPTKFKDRLLTIVQNIIKTVGKFCYLLCCIVCHIFCLCFYIACIFLLYHQFSVIVLILRSVVYILFIAITNYEHLLRIFIVVTSCFAYLGVFIAKFIDRYAAILKIIFDEFEKNIREAPKNPECAKEEKETIFIPEECFDYVIDHCYAVREHFFVVIFKIVITIMFFVLSLAVLLQSNIFDSTAKLTNIIDFVFIVVTPSVLFKFFDKDEQEIIHDHERDIRQRTNDYCEQLQEEKSKEDAGETSSSNKIENGNGECVKETTTRPQNRQQQKYVCKGLCDFLSCCRPEPKGEMKPLLQSS